jgi:carboxyl-terminal processing protease
MRTPRFLTVAVLIVVLSALAGGLFASKAAPSEDDVAQQYRVFTAALSAINSHYIEPLPSDRLVYGAIGGMLETLDPHSSFFDPKQYAQMREQQEGHYYGIGLKILTINGDVTAMSVFEGSPAAQAGIRYGDIISKVEGQSAKGWTTEQTAAKLKGPRGTKVNITISRPGYDKPIDLAVTRDEVHIVTVAGVFMLGPDTGYLRLTDFSETSGQEVHDALETLEKQGMKKLVFDLRDNPGGALDQAIVVANQFLPKGDMIVYTRGRIQNVDEDYHATSDPAFSGPMMVLVNRDSASASEIVTGALQDHDRALVVGETTFGKALVQSVYRISEGAGLALTTGHYFTPSGRMIQRPWDSSFDEYLTYTLRDQTGQQRQHLPSQLKYTDAGRKVYAGGGIEPDKFYDGDRSGFNPTRFGRALVARSEFLNFAERFAAQGDTRLTAASAGKKRLSRGFTVDDAMVNDFKSMLRTEKMKIDEDSFSKDLPFIKAMIHYEIDDALWGIVEAQKNLIAVDPQAQYAVTQMPEAVNLRELSKNRGSKGAN